MICKKISSAIGALKHNRSFITTKTAVQVYFSLIQPHFIERVHEFLKRRECASETSYVEPLESQSQSEDENEACDGSEYLSEAHNMSHDPVAANKDANIEYEKQGDSIL